MIVRLLRARISPAISIEVIRGPVTTRSTFTPIFFNFLKESLVAIETSSGVELPENQRDQNKNSTVSVGKVGIHMKFEMRQVITKTVDEKADIISSC